MRGPHKRRAASGSASLEDLENQLTIEDGELLRLGDHLKVLNDVPGAQGPEREGTVLVSDAEELRRVVVTKFLVYNGLALRLEPVKGVQVSQHEELDGHDRGDVDHIRIEKVHERQKDHSARISDSDLGLTALLHPGAKHGLEVGTARRKNDAMCVDAFAFNNEGHVREHGIVHKSTKVLDKGRAREWHGAIVRCSKGCCVLVVARDAANLLADQTLHALGQGDLVHVPVAKFAMIPVPKAPNLSIVSENHRVRPPASDLLELDLEQQLDHGGALAVFLVAMAELAVLAAAPRKELSLVGDRRRVEATAGNLDDAGGAEIFVFYHSWQQLICLTGVAEAAKLALAPGEDLAKLCNSGSVESAGSDLAHGLANELVKPARVVLVAFVFPVTSNAVVTVAPCVHVRVHDSVPGEPRTAVGCQSDRVAAAARYLNDKFVAEIVYFAGHIAPVFGAMAQLAVHAAAPREELAGVRDSCGVV
mmetsp:Transcript_24521/g.78279  ORF Transcript_24521/g.78279 Transcript_24521/m.78279 type:complete len:477 (+) Transcript_24521:161-1591(+)